MYKILKKPFLGRYMEKWREPVIREEKHKWIPFETKSRSGSVLKGLYHETPGARGTIVLGHPLGREAKGFFLKRGYHRFLIANRYNVVVFDFNGFGESGNGNFNYPGDIHTMGFFVKERFPSLPIGYLGISMGAAWGVCAFSKPGHVYSAAIFDSCFTTLDEFWGKDQYTYVWLKVIGAILPETKKRLTPVRKIGSLKNFKKVGFICSLEDELTPIDMTLRLREKCNVFSDLFVVNDSRHSESYLNDPEGYQLFVLNYFEEQFTNQISSNSREPLFRTPGMKIVNLKI